MTMTQPLTQSRLPLNLKIIVGLYVLKLLLATGFYIAFATGTVSVGSITPSLLLYTLIGYAVAFVAMMAFMTRGNLWGMRVCMAADFLISIPAKAFIGFVIGAVAIALSFTASVRGHLSGRRT
ncbi:hypothetical protein [Nitratireductor sp. XY-223]|uniref:hypothetical protein n=1 Tax=Nitratireductor sp. XY-223 TaxID=2561926 RepID=UPI0010AB334A|nr:hypothetical protein [Nitratireductor sp. XY-223]